MQLKPVEGGGSKGPVVEGGGELGWSTPAFLGKEGIKISNTPGSTAGAGSGEFHQYRYARRKEFFRLRQMETEAKKLDERKEYEDRKRAREEQATSRTAKKAAKRAKHKQKMKEKLNNPSATKKKDTVPKADTTTTGADVDADADFDFDADADAKDSDSDQEAASK